jgi:cbb3-type cytochrome oxidase subunit 1
MEKIKVNRDFFPLCLGEKIARFEIKKLNSVSHSSTWILGGIHQEVFFLPSFYIFDKFYLMLNRSWDACI